MTEITSREGGRPAWSLDRTHRTSPIERRQRTDRRNCERRSAPITNLVELGVVVPAYNEEAVIKVTAEHLERALDQLMQSHKVATSSRIWFVDDGSTDGTWEIVECMARQTPRVRGIRLSRNRGHQNALLAGLLTATGGALVSIDADLQDDISVIEAMLDEYQKGVDIVYGVRRRRDTDSVFKRTTALAFYRLMRVLGVETVENHADYRLMSRRAIEALRGFTEVNLFLRGIVPLIGFRSSCVYYERRARAAGESKYPFHKMIALAWNAITSFSVVPLRIITVLGGLVFLVSLGISMWVLWVRLFSTNALPGWASTVLPIALLGGLQILSLGVIGEYLGKLYAEAKRRPRYLIEKII